MPTSFAQEAEQLQAMCFPPPFPQEDLFRETEYLYDCQAFPEGQLMVLDSGKLVGSALNLIVSSESWAKRPSWLSLVGGLSIKHHDYDGDVLFGVDISVHPQWRNQGIGKALYEARVQLAKSLKLRLFATACRLPGLVDHSEMSPNDYAGKVVSGELTAMPLSALLKYGMSFVEVASDFMPDPPSRNCCAILEFAIK